jgi:hypothetical protein
MPDAICSGGKTSVFAGNDPYRPEKTIFTSSPEKNRKEEDIY